MHTGRQLAVQTLVRMQSVPEGVLAGRSSTAVRGGTVGKNNVFPGKSPKVAVLPDDHTSRLRMSAAECDELIRRGHGETRSIEDSFGNAPQLDSRAARS